VAVPETTGEATETALALDDALPIDALPMDTLPQTEAAVAGADGSAARRNWNQLLRKGRFVEIVSDARKLGSARAIATRPVSDLVALGQAARYTGDSALAEECWKAVRKRAPGSNDAHRSAFFLGRVMEQQGRRSDAIHWFQRYREESPGGVYAGQALGRQMVLSGGHGRSGAARHLAHEYLSRFPNGPYAKAARGVVSNGASGVAEPDDAVSEE
jgi:TolA-binding protein